MTTIQTAGTLLAADVASRVLRYLLLPFGVPGNTSAGLVTASAGTIELPADVTSLWANDEHDYKQPRSKFVSITETAAGLECSVEVLPTRAGDDLLAEAHAGAKTGISVEIANPVIRAGKLLAGKLTGAGHCVRPAFPTAQLQASDMGDLADAAQAVADQARALADAQAGDGTENTDATPTEKEAPPMAAAAAPAARPAAAGPLTASTQVTEAAAAAAPAGGALMAAANILAGENLEMIADQGLGALQAALNPINQVDMFDVATVPEYVGELWRGRAYVQRYATLCTRRALTAIESKGWRFKDGKTPQIFDYAGDLAAITSNDVELEAKSIKAKRLAGGHQIDRIYTDLPDGGAMAAYLRESQEDYLKKIDALTLAHWLDVANHTDSILPTLPAFYTGSEGWAKVLHGARVLLDHALPTFAIVGADLWFEMGLTSQDQKLEYLATSLGLEEGQAESFKLVGAPNSRTDLNGKVMVGTGAATTLEELPGGPVRVNTVGIANGSVDHGVFGYYKLWTPDPRYIVNVTDAA